MSDDPTNGDRGFPKPPRRAKRRRKRLEQRKGVNRVRPTGKHAYTHEQRARRKAEDTLYRKVTRPAYLLGLARRQGRLNRPNHEVVGESPQDKLANLTADEYPTCEAALRESGCRGERLAVHIHHKRGRRQYLNEPEWFIGTCIGCHDYIEDNRSWAREHGYLETRHKPVSERKGDERGSAMETGGDDGGTP